VNERELYAMYINKKEKNYSVEGARSQMMIQAFHLKMIMNSKQLKMFDEIEVSLREYEEVVLKDMFDFVVKIIQEKNTSD